MSLRSNPFMNDISTNYDEALNFKIAKHDNPLQVNKIIQDYGGYKKPYNDLDSLYISNSSFDETFYKSQIIFEKMNIEIKYKNLEEGIIEGESISFWYGFKDDFIIRIEELISGDIRIDVRSASRVGRSDFGKNYHRINEFYSNF